MDLFHIFLFLLNFFFLDSDPVKCARYHGDKHLNKMQLEYAQICSLVWFILVFENPQAKLGLDEKQEMQSKMYHKNKAHMKHPVVQWAAKSRAHYMAVVELGLALGKFLIDKIGGAQAERGTDPILGNEKRRRIAHMETLPASLRKPWKPHHASEEVLQYLHLHVPPLELFPNGSNWSDPPKVMPTYLHNDEFGNPHSVIQSYRLFYAGNKVKVTGLKWLPHVEEPDFLPAAQSYIESRPDLIAGILQEVLAKFEKKAATLKDPLEPTLKKARGFKGGGRPPQGIQSPGHLAVPPCSINQP